MSSGAPSTSLVLITGGTGHVGFCTLLHALRGGHRVRAAVRSEAKAAFLLSRPQIQSLSLADRTRLTFTVVPDITEDHAYDAAVRDVSHIIHIASPLVTGNQVPASQHDEYFVRPAVRGTLNILEAAQKSGGSVRRVVITSSIVALLPVEQMEGAEPRHHPVRPTDRVPFVPGSPYASEFACYSASKTAALAEAEAWMASERPAFDVIHLHPSFVQGRNVLADSTAEAMQGTNAVVLAMLLGKQWGGFAGATVHVEDVARVHVEALNEATIPGNRSYILDTPSRWNDAKDVVKAEFPDAVEKRLLVPSGSCESFSIPFDASETEAVFGIRFQSFADQVKSLVGHFLEIRTRPRATTFLNRRARPRAPVQMVGPV